MTQLSRSIVHSNECRYAINIIVYLGVITVSDWHLSHLVWQRRSSGGGGEGALETVWRTIFNYTASRIFDSNNSPDEQK